MIRFFKNNYIFISICFINLSIFWHSIFVFFTNDDFYFLKITRQLSLSKFINYFNIFAKNQDGFGVYRPLTTQLFYLINNPVLMHIVVFITFFGILYLIYVLGVALFKNNKLALIAVFLYSVSATHFGHFYYLATYQELGFTLFTLLMILSYIKGKKVLSIFCFIFALMSKETAIVAPFLLFIVDWYIGAKINYKKYVEYFVILSVYLFSHFYLYGLATGDTYIWDFGIKKLINTLIWYGFWSFNLPETFIDFIGPGFNINPNLWIYWSKQMTPILILFFIQVFLICYLFIRSMLTVHRTQFTVFIFSTMWFLISLVPVAFLPQHKFSFYLTLPLVGIVYGIAYLIKNNNFPKLLTIILLVTWLSLSVLTVRHSINTSWITQGEIVSRRVYKYFNQDYKKYRSNFVLVDAQDDQALPWSPTQVVKTALSDKNFFIAFFPSLVDKIFYFSGNGEIIYSRQFLGY